MNPRPTRSELREAQGFGSAKTGVAHWWMQRVTAVALIPLSLWLTANLIALAGDGHDAFIAWLRAPHATLLMILLLIVLFHHIALGLQVVVEDYVHSARLKLPAVMTVRLGCWTLAVAGVLAVARIAFSG